jgi:hypothetical protein
MKSHVLVAPNLEEVESNEPASVHTDGIELSRRREVG